MWYFYSSISCTSCVATVVKATDAQWCTQIEFSQRPTSVMLACGRTNYAQTLPKSKHIGDHKQEVKQETAHGLKTSAVAFVILYLSSKTEMYSCHSYNAQMLSATNTRWHFDVQASTWTSLPAARTHSNLWPCCDLDSDPWPTKPNQFISCVKSTKNKLKIKTYEARSKCLWSQSGGYQKTVYSVNDLQNK